MKNIYLVLLLFLTGCSAINNELEAYKEPKVEAQPRLAYIPASQEGSVHTYIEQLARQLFDTSNNIDIEQPVLVGTFLPAKTLAASMDPELQSLGIQLQESFATLSTQAGLTVIEFKSLPGVMITDNADVMLSRDKSKLNQPINAQYMITGNYVEQETSIVVNVKMINLSDKRLVAAATGYLPLDTLYSHNKVKMKDGLLYRGEY